MTTRRAFALTGVAAAVPLEAQRARAPKGSNTLRKALIGSAAALSTRRSRDNVRTLGYTLGLWFEQLDELGLVDQLAEAMDKALAGPPISVRQWNEIRRTAAANGVVVSGVAFERLRATGDNSEARERLRSELASHGIREFHRNLALTLAASADQDQTLVRPVGWWENVCGVMQIGGIYTATWTVMEAVGYIELGAVVGGGVGAAAGLAVAVASMYC